MVCLGAGLRVSDEDSPALDVNDPKLHSGDF